MENSGEDLVARNQRRRSSTTSTNKAGDSEVTDTTPRSRPHTRSRKISTSQLTPIQEPEKKEEEVPTHNNYKET